MPFLHKRTLRFADTDAASIVYFANYLSICHEAYEESLLARGFRLESDCRALNILLPVRRSEADYLRSLAAGEVVEIELTVRKDAADTFTVSYELWKEEGRRKRVAVAKTTHVCLDGRTRERMALPRVFEEWIQANAPGQAVSPG
jgi:1,4-dihydroxy-2-naphthoyl-CoA hydrolase